MILGCDPSLQGFGWALVSEGRLVSHQRWHHGPSPCRLTCFKEWFDHQMPEETPALVVIEGYAFGARNGREALGELGGLLRHALYLWEVPWITVPPPSLKLWITGQGRASKAAMRKALVGRLPKDEKLSHDEVDAYALGLLGEAFLQRQLPTALLGRLDHQMQDYPPQGAWTHEYFFAPH